MKQKYETSKVMVDSGGRKEYQDRRKPSKVATRERYEKMEKIGDFLSIDVSERKMVLEGERELKEDNYYTST
jgi:hypothetical protein